MSQTSNVRRIFFYIFIIMSGLIIGRASEAVGITGQLAGRILAATEQPGGLWYVNPENRQLYYLGQPAAVMDMIRALGLGVSNSDFDIWKGIAPKRLKGKILLKVEDRGQAYYVNPNDLALVYLGPPDDVMRILSPLAITVNYADIEAMAAGGSGGGTIDPITVQLTVPFTSQAPDGNWSNPVYEDGCEEAAILMAYYWANRLPLDSGTAAREISAIAQYEIKLDGEYRDRSITDTAALMRDYFGYNGVKSNLNITADDIINQLMNGNLVIAAVNGRRLGNPHYTPPGPPNHMLVVTGYDAASDEFITNDPGTHFGAGYRYPRAVIEDSLRDYPTGYRGTFADAHTAMITVEPGS